MPVTRLINRRQLKLDWHGKINNFYNMDKTLFETRAISVYNEKKYAFYGELLQGETLNRMTNGQYAGLLAVSAGLLAVGAALTGSGTSLVINRSNFIDGEVKTELIKLAALCDFIGINASAGVGLVLFVYSDNLTDEAIIGKSRLIYDGLSPFRKFSMRIGWGRLPVSAKVFFVFNNSEKAFCFRTSVQQHCKHHGVLKNLWVLPWGIDLAAKSVWAHRGMPLNWQKTTDLEAKLFS